MSAALLALALWVFCAGLTTIPLSRLDATRGLVDRYALRTIVIALALFWPAFLVAAIREWLIERGQP